jgi:hypothetical protein
MLGAIPPGHLIADGHDYGTPPVASCLEIIEHDPARPAASVRARIREVTFSVKMTSNTLPRLRSRFSVPALITGAGLVFA